MEQFKRAQVIILPHNNINTTITKYLPNTLSLNNDLLQSHTNQHLYIISDDEIKKDEHVYQTITKSIIKAPFNCFNDERFKKIIATTDTSLTNELYHPNLGTNVKTILPQPSQQFIEKYIEEYNKGNVIKDVLVEYEKQCNCISLSDCYNPNLLICDKKWKLKINSKDNTITIKKLKESWNREEVIELLTKRDKHLEESHFPNKLKIDTWIKENL